VDPGEADGRNATPLLYDGGHFAAAVVLERFVGLAIELPEEIVNFVVGRLRTHPGYHRSEALALAGPGGTGVRAGDTGKGHRMQQQRLGNTGLKVSRLCLGTMTFGYQTAREDSFAILDRAAEAGINFIDTADVYPISADLSTVGHSEEIVGHWLAGKRGDFILATKAGGKTGPKPWDRGASAKHLLEAVDASLRRLKTDYVDLYQLHYDDPLTPLDETLAALDQIVRSGRARYIGVSNFLAYRLALALGRAQARSWTRIICVQPRYNLLFRQMERELFPLASEEGLGVIPYNPLAGGLLTGKHRPDTPPAAGRFTIGITAKTYQERYWHDREFRTVDSLHRLAEEAGLSLTTLSVAWVLANPVVTSVIIGASHAAQLDATVAALSVQLDQAVKAQLDELTLEYRLGDATR
jgi:aryl-alcohol dehydrogenase (NADP+)